MIKKISKRRAILSGTAAVVAVATVITAVTIGADTKEYVSFEHIEDLKAQAEVNPMKVMEIAPSGDEGLFGYYVEGSEPTKNWKKIASMYDDKVDRVNYVRDIFKSLEDNKIMSADEDAAPLTKTADYNEWYPWDGAKPDNAEIMALDFEEEAYATGQMVDVGDGNGEYVENKDYVLGQLADFSVFDFTEFKAAIGLLKSVGQKNLKKSSAIKNGSTKVFAYDSTVNQEQICVFGSTQKNWNEVSGYEVYYDLTSVYRSNTINDNKYKYYSFNVQNGYTYSLNFDGLVTGGRGQVLVIPLDEDGKVVYYNPGYTKQYCLWNEYFNNTVSGEYQRFEYQFTVSENSPIKQVQVRFDISNNEACLKVKNLKVCEFLDTACLFNTSGYKKNGTSGVSDVSHTSSGKTVSDYIKVEAAAGSSVMVKCPDKESDDFTYFGIPEPKATGDGYTFTYHVENSGDGESQIKVYGFDENHANPKLIHYIDQQTKQPVGDDKAVLTNDESNTYSYNFLINKEDKIKYIGICFGAKGKETAQTSVFSNISFTMDSQWRQTGSAEYVQHYDHFETGVPKQTMNSVSSFVYEKWYASGSNAKKNSLGRGSISASENGIITLSPGRNKNLETNYSTGNFKESELLYYIPVNSGSYYHFSFRPTPKETAVDYIPVKYKITFYDKDRGYLEDCYGAGERIKSGDSFTSGDGVVTKSMLKDSFFTRDDILAPAGAAYAQISFGTTKAAVSDDQPDSNAVCIDYITLNEYVLPKAYYYNVSFNEISVYDEEGRVQENNMYVPAGTVGSEDFIIDSNLSGEQKTYYTKNEHGEIRKATASDLKTDGTVLYKGVALYVPSRYKEVGYARDFDADELDSGKYYYKSGNYYNKASSATPESEQLFELNYILKGTYKSLKDNEEYNSSVSYYYYDRFNDRYLKATGKIDDDTELYTASDIYVWAGDFGEDDFFPDLDEQYFTARINFSGFTRATASIIDDETEIFKYNFSNIPDSLGKYGDIKNKIDISTGEYYIKIPPVKTSYSSYIKATDSNTNDSTELYIPSSKTGYELVGVKASVSDFNSKTYYIRVFTVSGETDEYHPYYVIVDKFRKNIEGVEDPLFVRQSNSYTYVGPGNGNLEFRSGGSNHLVIFTKTVFTVGGYKNNNWFKRYVLDCIGADEEATKAACDKLKVEVYTLTPELLNSYSGNPGDVIDAATGLNADQRELRDLINGFSLLVVSTGANLSAKTNAVYSTDLSDDVIDIIRDAVLKEDENDEAYTPAMVDVNMLKISNSISNLKAFATELCQDYKKNEKGIKQVDENNKYIMQTCSTGGVTDYLYRFDSNDIGFAKLFITSNQFKTELDTDKDNYTIPTSPYYDVWIALSYENTLRQIRGKNKYNMFDEHVSEADCIRHILNYKGQRVINKKGAIKVLEIQPETTESQLYYYDYTNPDGSIIAEGHDPVWVYGGTDPNNAKFDLNKWFVDPNGKSKFLEYVDDYGNAGQTKFEITTTTPYELNGKIEDIAECYDVIYVGTSLDNLTPKVISGDRPDKGDIVPKRDRTPIDELFYITMGEDHISSSSGLQRSELAGLCRSDYKVLANLWWVDASDCTLREDGNDLTSTKSEELQAIIDLGLPVIVSDDLCLQDFYNNLTCKAMGKYYYQRKSYPVYMPGHDGEELYSFYANENGQHVLLSAEVSDNLPEGTIVSYSWRHAPSYPVRSKGESDKDYISRIATAGTEIKTTEQQKITFLGITLKTNNVDNKSYKSIDQNGDGIGDLYFIDFDISKYPKNEDYWCVVNFDFSQCAGEDGSPLKYNGLFITENSTETVVSNAIRVEEEKRTYQLYYYDYANENSNWNSEFAQYCRANGISINGANPTSQNEFVRKNGYKNLVGTYPAPSAFGDYIEYNFRNSNDLIVLGGISYHNNHISAQMAQNGDVGTDKMNAWVTDGDRTTIKWEIGACYIDRWNDKHFAVSSWMNNEDEDGSTGKTSVGYRKSGGSTFTKKYNRTINVNAVKLMIKDSEGKLINDNPDYIYDGYTIACNSSNTKPGGYMLSGVTAEGLAITGPATEFREGADLLKNRIDTSSYLYYTLKKGFANNPNVFTRNQVERKDQSIAYRDRMVKCANLSEPVIEIIGSNPSFPNPSGSVNNSSISFNFRIKNDTELDTIGTRYRLDYYVDINGDGQFSDSEKQTDYSIYPYEKDGLQTDSAANGEHIYQFTGSMGASKSPIRPYKIKVTKIGEEGAHGSYTGYAYSKKSTRNVVNAIQVLPGDWDPEYVSLLPSGNDAWVDYNGDGVKNDKAVPGTPSNYNMRTNINEKNGFNYSENWYKGSVFLGEAYYQLTKEAINEAFGSGTKLVREIYYCESGMKPENARYDYEGGYPKKAILDDNYNPTPDTGEYVYDPEKFVHHVTFIVGDDYELNIYFTNISDMNNSYTTTSEKGVLDGFDMIIMGFGDSYSKLGLGKTYNAIHTDETLGFNQNATLALESKLNGDSENEPLPVLFCHDSTTYKVNFVNYALNDAGSFFNSVANGVTNWWNKFTSEVENFFKGNGWTADEDEINKYNGEIHSSRLKQGYYSNLILRDPLGMDSFGITAKIKERANYNYNDNGLKQGHSYNTPYKDSTDSVLNLSTANMVKLDNTTASSYMEWKQYYDSLSPADQKKVRDKVYSKAGSQDVVELNVLMMEENGYSIAWEATKNELIKDGNRWKWDNTQPNSQVNLYTQGFTYYTLMRFSHNDGGNYMTDTVTQVNKGKITLYPYNIDLDTQVAANGVSSPIEGANLYNTNITVGETHQQYFQINLNHNVNANGATVWYCLAKSDSANSSKYGDNYGYCRNDCKDNYYVYTKANATYTGAGHHNVFTIFEAKFFLNTIVAADQSDTRVPKVHFYDNKGQNPVNYVTLVGEDDYNTKDFGSSGTYNGKDYITKGKTEAEDYTKYFVWTDDLHFKISNTSSGSVGNEKYRTVFFYVKDNPENHSWISSNSSQFEEVTVNEEKVYKLKENIKVWDNTDKEGDSASLNQIIPGQLYTMAIPNVILKKMVSDQGEIDDAKVEMYIHVELTLDEEAAKYTLASDENCGLDTDLYQKNADGTFTKKGTRKDLNLPRDKKATESDKDYEKNKYNGYYVANTTTLRAGDVGLFYAAQGDNSTRKVYYFYDNNGIPHAYLLDSIQYGILFDKKAQPVVISEEKTKAYLLSNKGSLDASVVDYLDSLGFYDASEDKVKDIILDYNELGIAVDTGGTVRKVSKVPADLVETTPGVYWNGEIGTYPTLDVAGLDIYCRWEEFGDSTHYKKSDIWYLYAAEGNAEEGGDIIKYLPVTQKEDGTYEVKIQPEKTQEGGVVEPAIVYVLPAQGGTTNETDASININLTHLIDLG